MSGLIINNIYEFMTVEPIKDKSKIIILKRYLENNYKIKYFMIFMFGVNTGLRVGDILKLKVKDIVDLNEDFRDYLGLKETKTGKEKKIKINDSLRALLANYIKGLKLNKEDFLFPSSHKKNIVKAMDRRTVWKILKQAATNVGIENFGTHTMRKTWGYWSYIESGYNIGLIQSALNHSSPAITLRYIGINQQQKDDLYNTVQF